MRILKNFIIRTILIFYLINVITACKSVNSFIIKKEKILIYQDSKHKIISFYPVIHFLNQDSLLNKLNKSLEDVNELEYSKQELIEGVSKCDIIGDFKVLYKSDSLLCIEYFKQYDKNSPFRYMCVFVNLTRLEIIKPEYLPTVDRSVLYKHVKKFCDNTNIYINLLAYKNDNYLLTYGMTKKDFILYIGLEGEWGGRYKLIFPLSELPIFKINLNYTRTR